MANRSKSFAQLIDLLARALRIVTLASPALRIDTPATQAVPFVTRGDRAGSFVTSEAGALTATSLVTRGSIFTMLGVSTLFMLTFGFPACAEADVPPSLAEGQKLAHDVMKGNCLACHMVPGDPKAVTSANIGPPLIAMKARFPDRDKMRAQIWDAAKANPDTVMPPYGRHKILTETEIDKLVDYVSSL